MRPFIPLVLAATLAFPLSATEPNPSQDQRKAIEKLFVVMKIDATMRNVVDGMFAEIEKQFLDEATANGGGPEELAEGKELFQSFRKEASKIDFGGLLNEGFLRIYAKYFTDKEIDEMTAFYATPTGQKAIDLMDEMMREGMQLGMQELAPKISEVMTKVREENEKKHPWRRTMSDITEVATALEAWSLDNDEKFPRGDYASLEETLSEYLDEFPQKDIWGHAYAYSVSDDGKRYRLVSAGADSIFEWDSRRISDRAELRYRDRLDDDVVYADGAFVQLPVQAKPKEKQ
jgi:uncharacterized protein